MSVISYNQTISITAPQSVNTFSFASTPMAATGGTLTVRAAGDLDGTGSNLEEWVIQDESATQIGSIGATGSFADQCNTTLTVSISLTAAQINSWAANGSIDFTAIDLTGLINNALCTSVDFIEMTLAYAGQSGDTSCCVYPCPVVMAPVTETFNTGSIPTSVWPTCDWGFSNYAAVGDGWRYTGNPGYNASPLYGNNRAAGSFAWIDFSSTDDSTCLEGGDVDISNLTSPVVSFDYFSNAVGSAAPYNTASYAVTPNNIMYVEAWDGSAWNQVGMLQLEAMGWNQYGFSLSGHSYNTNLVKIRLRGESGGATLDFYQDI